jgi:amino acid permease
MIVLYLLAALASFVSAFLLARAAYDCAKERDFSPMLIGIALSTVSIALMTIAILGALISYRP